MQRETARFDAPRANNGMNHDRVQVTRHEKAQPKPGEVVRTDQLECDHLDLQFRRKTSPAPKSGEPKAAVTEPSQSKEIDFALATADPGQIVEVRSESEDLHAFAAEMRYYSATAASGARTTLKGSPVHALRQGHRIECVELDLKAADKNGNGQQVFAKGPGRIDLLDKQTGRHSVHIHWRTSLTSTKDRESIESDRVFDLLTLRDDALV